MQTRAQLLENKLIESYDERIEAAGQVTEAVFASSQSSKEMKVAVDELVKMLNRRK